MNDKGLWPIHLIFFGTIIALVGFAIKSIFEEFARSPGMILVVIALSIAYFLTRSLLKRG
jgi:hypothetical protein